MITNAIDAVKEFNEAFKIKYSKNQKADLDESTIELRYRLMQEENDEYLEAARKKDLVEIADALGDKLYILCGTILAHGLQDKILEVFDEIQRSNMSKLSADGTPVIREDGKILKICANEGDTVPVGSIIAVCGKQDASNEEIVGFNRAIAIVADKLGISEQSGGNGYRLIANAGKDSHQEVPHLHFHLLAGRPLGPMVLAEKIKLK